ncbi:helix-turn-helix domain-containing protein [Candidatus Woesearchaeota archaeon]|nr:helix-turn-helix domain-containing protein [Candidatus Woesearchaeota archaeon]
MDKLENEDLIVDAYNELCSYENLEIAFNRARRGKTLKEYVINFEKDLKDNLLQLRSELLMHTYQPKPLKTFILRDPKTRKISKSDFRDRVVHHAICNIIEPVFEKRFIYDSFANRLGKGTLNAINRFDTFKKKVSQNNTIRCYVLKADIKSYFDTVNHDLLMKILNKRIHDGRILWLIRVILDNHQSKTENKGMPLGNLTSQFFANVYLNELDQFVKHKLRATYYIRYVDDFVILHQSKTLLEEYKKRINAFLRDELDLKLHPEKSQVLRLEKGVGFLGFRVFFHHKILVKKNMRKFEKKMQRMKRLYQHDKIDREKVIEKYEGWIAYASNANTYKYRKRMTSKFNMAFPARPEISITSVKKHENFNDKVYASKIEFTQQKTLQLIKKGFNVKKIAETRGIKESTVWDHVANLVQHHQLPLKRVMKPDKIRKILNSIKSPEDKLRDIKTRLGDESISYNEIQVVLANVKGKHAKKSISYYADWYQRTNCFRKCYFNKNQRQECRFKFQQLIAKGLDMEFSKHDFLDFFHNHVNICKLPDKDKKKFVPWKEFKDNLRKRRSKK